MSQYPVIIKARKSPEPRDRINWSNPFYHDRLVSLVNAGMSDAQIAADFGLTRDSIRRTRERKRLRTKFVKPKVASAAATNPSGYTIPPEPPQRHDEFVARLIACDPKGYRLDLKDRRLA